MADQKEKRLSPQNQKKHKRKSSPRELRSEIVSPNNAPNPNGSPRSFSTGMSLHDQPTGRPISGSFLSSPSTTFDFLSHIRKQRRNSAKSTEKEKVRSLKQELELEELRTKFFSELKILREIEKTNRKRDHELKKKETSTSLDRNLSRPLSALSPTTSPSKSSSSPPTTIQTNFPASHSPFISPTSSTPSSPLTGQPKELIFPESPLPPSLPSSPTQPLSNDSSRSPSLSPTRLSASSPFPRGSKKRTSLHSVKPFSGSSLSSSEEEWGDHIGCTGYTNENLREYEIKQNIVREVTCTLPFEEQKMQLNDR